MPNKPKRGSRTQKSKASKAKKPKKVAVGFDQNITKRKKALS